MFGAIYQNRRVFLTGHTGFKGSWLHLWLERLGAQVTGYSLAPATTPCHCALLGLGGASILSDLRDYPRLLAALQESQPEIVFHLAAQASVLVSYDTPVDTFATNVIGTANLLEACRQVPSVRAVVVVTTDKCYENREWVWGYRENDALGGYDPYSTSKACTELVVSSYRRSFFAGGGPLVATARAGNVIGGGDWTADRLVPDVARAAAAGEPVIVRNPGSTRPWQHVLEPLAGYMLLAQSLFAGRQECAEAWNFGPDSVDHMSVLEVIRGLGEFWPEATHRLSGETAKRHEAGALSLDCAKAKSRLGWRPIWGREAMLRKSAEWYRAYYLRNDVISVRQLDEYIADATAAGLAWTAE